MTEPRRHPLSRLLRSNPSPGAPPGTVVHVGAHKPENITLSLIDYTSDAVQEIEDTTVEECFEIITGPGTTWVDMVGLTDVARLNRIGDRLKIHPLVREDIANTGQRPKLESYGEYLYLVLRQLRYDAETHTVDDEQISFIVTRDYVFTFQERPGDVFGPIRERIRASRGVVRNRGADYLAYALIDCVVDGYFQVIEAIGDRVDELENSVVDNSDSSAVRRIHELKREMLMVRRAVWPLRDVTNTLARGDIELIQAETRLFFRDVYDHSVQIIDAAESLRDVLSSTMDLQLSIAGNRMNEVMQVLTIIATIFIPLSFFTGLYGMNFEWMPELGIRWAYPTLLVMMAAGTAGMLIYFRKRGWL